VHALFHVNDPFQQPQLHSETHWQPCFASVTMQDTDKEKKKHSHSVYIHVNKSMSHFIESNGCFSKKSWMRKAQHIINNAFCNFTHKGLNYICMSYHITFMDERLQQGWKTMTHFLKHCRECIICPQSLLQNKIYLNPSTYKISKEKEHMIPTRHQTKTYANWQGQWARS
jgi:hypothetical protein